MPDTPKDRGPPVTESRQRPDEDIPAAQQAPAIPSQEPVQNPRPLVGDKAPQEPARKQLPAVVN